MNLIISSYLLILFSINKMKTTINNYIISIKRYNGYKFEHYGEGTVKILKDDEDHYIQLHDTNKKTLLCENNLSKDKMHFSFRKTPDVSQVIFDFEYDTYGIEFDSNSFASFNEFEKNIKKIINTSIKEVYYDSGNLKFSGEFVDGKLNGNGWEFYDSINPVFKYQGEFEDGMYDGEGVFVSRDGLIKVHINNITENVPHDYGKLIVKDVGEWDVDFSKYDINIQDDNFCYNLAEIIVGNVKEKLFKNLPITQQISLLWDKMNELTIKIDKINEKKNPLKFW